jgi:prohibitin 2
MVQISLRVLFRPDGGRLASLYRLLGTDYDERVLPSIVNEVTKAVVAQYKAAELLTMRETVSAQIREVLRKRAGDFNILLDDVAITHLAFSKEYTAAVEAKQVALQESQRAKYIVDKARMEKESIIVKATGEARSAELIGTAIRKNPAFLQLRRIDAAKEVASSVVHSAGKIYIDSENLLLNHLGEQTDLDKEQKAWWRW